MNIIVFIILFISSTLNALNVTVTDGVTSRATLLMSLAHGNEEEQLIADKLYRNFNILDRLVFLKTQGAFNHFSQYREQKIDFLGCLSIDSAHRIKKVTFKLLSPWGASLTTPEEQWPLMLHKTFEFQTNEDLLKISNQLTDDIAAHALCLKGFASYPLAYVHRDKQTHIIMSDLAGDLSSILYTSTAPILSLTWSPDARHLAFIELTTQGPVLKIINRHEKIAKDIVTGMYVSSPVFSKDNRYLYYVAASISVGQVFKKDLVTDYTEALTTGEDWMIDLSRGLDPYHLLVTADRSGGAQLYEFNILNKKFKRLTFSEAECSKGVLSLQNQAMFYSMLSATASILVKRSFMDKTYEAITLSEQGAESPTFPDARGLIAFEQLYNEHTVIVFKTLDSGKETMLIAAPKGDYSCPSWASQPGF